MFCIFLGVKQTMEELISIIIPIYNSEKYLERCIESVLNQTYYNLQIILVDDGSVDKSYEICEQYRELDDRIVVIRKPHGGAGEARNVGMRILKGVYVGFVDSDDYVEHDMYEKLYYAIKTYRVPIACCGRVNLYEEGMGVRNHKSFVRKEVTCYSKESALKALCLYDSMDFSPCDKLIDANLLRGIQFPTRRVAEDIPVVYELYSKSEGVVHIGKAKYFYCHRENSTTTRKFTLRRLDYLLFIQDIYRDILNKYPKMRREAEVLFFNAIIIMWHQVREDLIEAERHLAIEKRLRRLLKHYLLRYIFNPYIEKRQYSDLIQELLFDK